MRTRQLQCVETPRDSLGVSNTNLTLFLIYFAILLLPHPHLPNTQTYTPGRYLKQKATFVDYHIIIIIITIIIISLSLSLSVWGGRMVRWCWINFRCRGVLLIWIIVGQGPTALAAGAGGGCLDIFLSSIISLFFLAFSLWETAGHRLKYCLKETLSQKQPTNRPTISLSIIII